MPRASISISASTAALLCQQTLHAKGKPYQRKEQLQALVALTGEENTEVGTQGSKEGSSLFISTVKADRRRNHRVLKATHFGNGIIL